MIAVLLLKRLNPWRILKKQIFLCLITHVVLHLLSLEVKILSFSVSRLNHDFSLLLHLYHGGIKVVKLE